MITPRWVARGRVLTYRSPQQDAALARLQATNYSPGNSASVAYAQKNPDSNAVSRSCMPTRDVGNSHEAEVAIHRPRCPNRAPPSGRAARSSIRLRRETNLRPAMCENQRMHSDHSQRLAPRHAFPPRAMATFFFNATSSEKNFELAACRARCSSSGTPWPTR